MSTKKTALLIILFLTSLFQIKYVTANTLIERKINGYSAKIIEYDTNSTLYNIKIGVHPKDGGTLRSIMREVGGVTGVNGVFECPKDYSSCGGKNYTINERYVNGIKKFKYKSTGDRVVFGWDKNIVPFLFQTDTINKENESLIWEGFANHPLLLKSGESQTHIYHKKGLINHKMKAKATKNFICSNKQKTKIFFGFIYQIDIDETALALKSFGCWDAINLDAGFSTTFIYNGKYVIRPQRDILDGVFIVPKNIDIQEIEESAKKIIIPIIKKEKNKSYSEKIEFLKKINIQLNNLAKDIYKKNTTPIFQHTNIYKKVQVLKGINSNPSAIKLIKTQAFKDAKILFVENNNIYKKELNKIEKVNVGTRIEINSEKTLRKIYLINLLRTYTNEIIILYQKIEKLGYIKKLDLNVNIEVNI